MEDCFHNKIKVSLTMNRYAKSIAQKVGNEGYVWGRKRRQATFLERCLLTCPPGIHESRCKKT